MKENKPQCRFLADGGADAPGNMRRVLSVLWKDISDMERSYEDYRLEIEKDYGIEYLSDPSRLLGVNEHGEAQYTGNLSFR